MTVLFVPVFRAAIGYHVTLGRRWSILEQMLLVELSKNSGSLKKLSELSNLPERVVIEALINLLRAGWIEVRSTPEESFFAATPIGKRRAAEEDLQPQLRRELKWASLCMDRLTGSWIRTDDLDLVYERDLPNEAQIIDPLLSTLNYDDPDVRSLIYLNSNEGFDGFQPASRPPSKPYARVEVSYGEIEVGLPNYAPIKLRHAVISEAAQSDNIDNFDEMQSQDDESYEMPKDTLKSDDIIVGGAQHLDVLQRSLERAKSHIVIHSCFIHPEVIKKLIPDFEKAARRRVRIDLLWGLHVDPEADEKPKALIESERVLNELSAVSRARVQLSPISSGSHAKIIIYDDTKSSNWVSITGSCNWLSSWFSAIDVSVKSRSQRLVFQILGYLISAQLPASGGWSSVARRLNRSWNDVRAKMSPFPEVGDHALRLLSDADHYACVTMARDRSRESINIGCDLFGLSAETSVLVPMVRASELGRQVNLFYQRPSKLLRETGKTPDDRILSERGLSVKCVENLHGKFLTWDDNAVAITSFNWLSTVVDGTRNRGAEIGVLIFGAGMPKLLQSKLKAVSNESLIISISPNDDNIDAVNKNSC